MIHIPIIIIALTVVFGMLMPAVGSILGRPRLVDVGLWVFIVGVVVMILWGMVSAA